MCVALRVLTSLFHTQCCSMLAVLPPVVILHYLWALIPFDHAAPSLAILGIPFCVSATMEHSSIACSLSSVVDTRTCRMYPLDPLAHVPVSGRYFTCGRLHRKPAILLKPSSVSMPHFLSSAPPISSRATLFLRIIIFVRCLRSRFLRAIFTVTPVPTPVLYTTLNITTSTSRALMCG